MINTLRFSTLGFLAALFLSQATTTEAQVLRRLLDLRGEWKFALGDDPARSSQSFDDRSWATIRVPSSWEDEGYPGYNGHAWYRKHFRLPADWQDKSLYLVLGRIDDVDQVFVNGKPIGGRGSFPPAYRSAYGDVRQYPLVPTVLEFGKENVIAVHVYDSELVGGMVGKEVAVSEDEAAVKLEESLAGNWRFSTGDDPSWKDPAFDDSRWNEVTVPAFWESQGYPAYDGIGWYRLRFRVRPEIATKDIILLLGKIDDVDEVYLNGESIGNTGRINLEAKQGAYGDTYKKVRAYTIPAGKLSSDRNNLIAVRVHDNWRDGGIYEGPIGFVTPGRYKSWIRRQGKQRSVWDLFEEIIR